VFRIVRAQPPDPAVLGQFFEILDRLLRPRLVEPGLEVDVEDVVA